MRRRTTRSSPTAERRPGTGSPASPSGAVSRAGTARGTGISSAAVRSESSERNHLVVGELAPRAGVEPVDAEARVATAVEAANRVADRLEHPLHLVLAPLVDRELDPRRAESPHPGRSAAAVVELDALGQPGQRFV